MKRTKINACIFFSLTVVFLFSCDKSKDFRDRFTGIYNCDYVKISQTQIIIPDCTFYLYDTSCSSNVPFKVSKGNSPDKLIILEVEIKVHDDGSLENYWIPGRSISGSFYHGDSIQITQGVGKEEGYREHWTGKRL